MIELARTVRFAINDPTDAASAWGDPTNTFAAFPTMRGLGRHYELDVRCRGEIDPRTGYFIDIKDIDRAVRHAVIPMIESACRARPSADPAITLQALFTPLAQALRPATLSSVRWRLSPYHSLEMTASATHTALLRQQFEFAAAHRLHVASLSDEENRRLFGKCNNAAGHGHNYRVEPCVEMPVGQPRGDARASPAFSLADLERITKAVIIDRFDHKHLNLDLPEFRAPDGLNPSVENIARICFDLLSNALQAAGHRVRLRSVTVWETDKTSCTYPAGPLPPSAAAANMPIGDQRPIAGVD